MNQFKYSLDNKRYHTYNYYLKNKYHQKVAKVALNADFTCPNRDTETDVISIVYRRNDGDYGLIETE